MSLFDELVQNEVNRVHNQFAKEGEELPVVSSSLLMERATRVAPAPSRKPFNPRKHGVLGPTHVMDPKKEAAIDKERAKVKKRMAAYAREIENNAKAIGHTVLTQPTTIAVKDQVQDRVHHMKRVLTQIDTSIRLIPTETSGSRYGEAVDSIQWLIIELDRYSFDEMAKPLKTLEEHAASFAEELELSEKKDQLELSEKKDQLELSEKKDQKKKDKDKKPAYGTRRYSFGAEPKYPEPEKKKVRGGYVAQDELLGDIVDQLVERSSAS